MFSQEGWRHFQEEMQHLYDTEQSNADILYPTNDDWQVYRGRKDLMRSIIGYEQYIRAQLENIDNHFEDNPDADCL